MKNNVRYVATRKCIERLTELQIFWHQMVASFFLLPVSQLCGFPIDQMKFICLAQGIRIRSLQRCYNISDVGTALQQSCYSQLWQAIVTFFLSSFVDPNWLLLLEINLVRVLRATIWVIIFWNFTKF